MAKRDTNDYANSLRSIAPYLDLGWRFGLSVTVGGVLGYLLDGKLHSQPIGLLIGVMFGATAGFINLYQNVMRLTRSEKRRKRDSRSSRTRGMT